MLVKENDIDYFAADELSNSRLTQILKCPLLFKENPLEVSKSLGLGALFHAMVLEPETVNEKFQQKLDGRTKEGKVQAQLVKDKGLTLVTQADLETATAMTESLAKNSEWQKIVNAGFDAEVSVHNTFRGLGVKGKLDALYAIDGETYIADLKSTKDSSPESIQKSIATYGYHRQAAWYKMLMRLEGVDIKEFTFFFVESSAPYIVTPVILDSVAEEVGMEELEFAVQRYIDCIQTDSWPAYTESVAYIGLPGYYNKKIAI